MIPSECRVLVVDDEMIMREYLTDILADQGFQVTSVSSGEEALEKIKQETFHIVITDMRMPGVTGVEVFRATKHKMPPPKVILITAFAMDMSGKQYLDEGAFGFILKPFDLEQIRKLVFSALEVL